MTDYLDFDEAKSLLGIRDQNDDVAVEAAITAASRQIDSICQRSFGQDSTVSLRKYRPNDYYSVPVDDISTATGLIVGVDTGDTGTASQTLTLDCNFYLEPVNGVVDGISGWPYTTICTTTTTTFTPYSLRPSVHVTARWGWPAVPEPVQQACGVLTEWLFKMKDAPLGVAGYGDFGAIRVREHPVVTLLLQPYIKRAVLVG